MDCSDTLSNYSYSSDEEVDTEECVVHFITDNMGKQMRSNLGCLQFNIFWKDSDAPVWKGWGESTIEPIWNVIDIENKEITEQLIPILKNYYIRTQKYPRTRRCCWFCREFTETGSCLCGYCENDFAWVTEMIKEKVNLDLELKAKECKEKGIKTAAKWEKQRLESINLKFEAMNL